MREARPILSRDREGAGCRTLRSRLVVLEYGQCGTLLGDDVLNGR